MLVLVMVMVMVMAFINVKQFKEINRVYLCFIPHLGKVN